MYLEVIHWPESQNVMDNPDWFFIAGSGDAEDVIGSSAYAKVIDKQIILKLLNCCLTATGAYEALKLSGAHIHLPGYDSCVKELNKAINLATKVIK